MSATSIEWTDESWNPVAGCNIVSPGCLNCYAMQMAARLEAMGQPKYQGLTRKKNGKATWTGKIMLDATALDAPFRWKKPRMVFVNSMSDLFHERVPFEFIAGVYATMAATPHHTYQILTKRPERRLEFWNWFPSYYNGPRRGDLEIASSDLRLKTLREAREVPWPLPNVWEGVSVEDQQRADERIPFLLQTPAAVRFLSVEPLLGPMDLVHTRTAIGGAFLGTTLPGIDWVICGGESGHGARPCNVEWIRSIVAQCQAAGVSCFVKQLGTWSVDLFDGNQGRETGRLHLKDKKGGDWSEWPDGLRVRQFPEASLV